MHVDGAHASTDGARRDVVLAPEVHTGLVELGRAAGTTPFMTLLAAFYALLVVPATARWWRARRALHPAPALDPA